MMGCRHDAWTRLRFNRRHARALRVRKHSGNAARSKYGAIGCPTLRGAPSRRRDAALRRAAELTLQNGYSAFRLMPIYVHAFDEFGVTVVMFHAGAYGAFDAAAVLRKQGESGGGPG
jgi:hypothetical protein